MRILFLGDIVGRPGRSILAENLRRIREELKVDFVIANAENAAGGNGITKSIAKDLFKFGVDAITLGDHLWDQRSLEGEIDSVECMCRPANIPQGNPGRDFTIVEKGGVRLGVFCLLGQTLMKIKSDCPYAAATRMVEKISPLCDAVFLDFHAETSSEKVSMGWHLDGKVAAVVGTHTHIPTADARVLPQGTAYQTDAGMTGPWEGCLGRDWRPVLDKFVDGRPRQFKMALYDSRICGCLIDYDLDSRAAKTIETFVWPAFHSTWESRRAETARQREKAEQAAADARQAAERAASLAAQACAQDSARPQENPAGLGAAPEA